MLVIHNTDRAPTPHYMSYGVTGNTLVFNQGEFSIDLSEYESILTEYLMVYRNCRTGEWFINESAYARDYVNDPDEVLVADIRIPPRKYNEIEVDDYTTDEHGNRVKYSYHYEEDICDPIPFDIHECTLTLYFLY